MSGYNDSDSEELDDYEFSRLEKCRQLKHFSINDYLSCRETNFLLKQDWNNEYESTENEFEKIFIDYKSYFNEKGYNILALADNIHQSDFSSLIKHHIKKKYNILIFEEEPSLAAPLVEQIDEIRKKKELQKKQHLIENYKKSNKTFDWNTKKYV